MIVTHTHRDRETQRETHRDSETDTHRGRERELTQVCVCADHQLCAPLGSGLQVQRAHALLLELGVLLVEQLTPAEGSPLEPPQTSSSNAGAPPGYVPTGGRRVLKLV